MLVTPDKKIYFLSDFHLGAPDVAASLVREKKIIRFLDEIKSSASAIYILGDIFDFWYEYKNVVPKGYIRLLGKLAELTDAGIPIHVFIGNHDMWMSGYFEQALNIPVYHEPQIFTFNNKNFYIGHGDGLGPGDNGYKFIKKIFRNPICKWLFGWIHPDIGIKIANYFSKKSRQKTGSTDEQFLGEENEWLIIYSKELIKKDHFDFLIFGHRHLPIDIRLSEQSRYINLGDWITHFTYAEFDGNEVKLCKYH
jgi:UDP-2,3-diacylglucosamine hydrolase